MGRRPSPFPDVASAKKKFYAHPVFQWLALNVRTKVGRSVINEYTFFRQIRTALAVVEHIAYASGQRLQRARPDKKRKAIINAVKRIEEGLNDGMLSLGNPAQEEVLEVLLARATERLTAKGPKVQPVKLPWLKDLAKKLYEETGRVDWRLLLDVAAALDCECDEQTARRYATAAQSS
jgi:hypothetical protein